MLLVTALHQSMNNPNSQPLILAIPDSLFEKIKGQNVVKYMRACKEINIAFIPYEEQVRV